MNILVLGAGGFIGNHLVSQLVKQGHYVCGVDLKYPEFSESVANEFIITDLREFSNFTKFPNLKFDEIYQLAADMGGALYVFTGEHDSNIMTNSVTININTLKYICNCEQLQATVFFSSSACIYPLYNQLNPANPKCNEASAYPADPDSEYGWEKLFSERLYLAHAKNHNINVRIARYHNIYGPLGTWDGGKEKSPAAICRKVIRASDSIEIIGNGQQTRSFLYIDDCVSATVALVRSNINFPINIGSEEMVTINQLADVACSVENKILKKIYIDGPTGVPGRTSDNTLIKQHLNWSPAHSLTQGINKTYTWIQSQIN